MAGETEHRLRAVQGALRTVRIAGRGRPEPAHGLPQLLSPDAVLGLLRAGRTTMLGGTPRDETGKDRYPRSTGAHRL